MGHSYWNEYGQRGWHHLHQHRHSPRFWLGLVFFGLLAMAVAGPTLSIAFFFVRLTLAALPWLLVGGIIWLGVRAFTRSSSSHYRGAIPDLKMLVEEDDQADRVEVRKPSEIKGEGQIFHV